MPRQVRLWAFVVFFTPGVVLAQHSCPQGFQHAGTLSGTGSFSGDFNERRAINLTENATIDTTYQQTNIRSHGGNPKAHSDLTAKEIPKGIHIITYGSTDLNNGWSVSAPKLVAVNVTGSESVTRYRFGMNLYCTIGRADSQNVGGCDVHVDVCYLPKK